MKTSWDKTPNKQALLRRTSLMIFANQPILSAKCIKLTVLTKETQSEKNIYNKTMDEVTCIFQVRKKNKNLETDQINSSCAWFQGLKRHFENKCVLRNNISSRNSDTSWQTVSRCSYATPPSGAQMANCACELGCFPTTTTVQCSSTLQKRRTGCCCF